MKVALIAIGRLENQYAREFVGHHLALGFDHIIIADNNHDGEDDFRSVLSDFIADKKVTIADYRNRAKAQRMAYNELYHRYRNDYDWIAFFDFDELLCLSDGLTNIKDLLQRFDGQASCIMFPWMMMSDSGLVHNDQRPLMERFTERSADVAQGKCIVRGGISNLRFTRSVHVPYEPALRCVTPAGLPTVQKRHQPNDFSVAYLKHFSTKTIEEWLTNKWPKGAAGVSYEKFTEQYRDYFFQINERTQEKEQFIVEYEMKKRMIEQNRIALCAIGRLENQYAREFVEHYLALGFDHIIIADNNHDGEDDFRSVLSDFIADKKVTIADYRNRDKVQMTAYNELYHRYGSQYTWMAFFDFDEFLTIVSGEDIHTFMQRYRGHHCLLINWMNYTDSGQIDTDGRPVQERLTVPMQYDKQVDGDFPENNHVKSIVRTGIAGLQFQKNPHVPTTPVLVCCGTDGKICKQKARHTFDHSTAYLKHYTTKTIGEWLRLKMHRGVADRDMQHFQNDYNDFFFRINERTPEKEAFIQQWNNMTSQPSSPAALSSAPFSAGSGSVAASSPAALSSAPFSAGSGSVAASSPAASPSSPAPFSAGSGSVAASSPAASPSSPAPFPAGSGSVAASSPAASPSAGRVAAVALGRMGNQMFEVAAAMTFARRTGREFVGLVYNLGPKYDFDYPKGQFSTVMRKVKYLQPSEVSGFYHMTQGPYISNSFPDIKEPDVVLCDYFQDNTCIDRDIALQLFRPYDSIKKEIKTLYGDLSDVVCVNVRRGDYLEVQRRGFRVLTKEQIEDMLEEHFPDAQRVLFVSDDIPWCRQHFTGARYLFADKPCHYKPEMDLYLISQCGAGCIIANSSFSWWGAYLNEDCPKVVVPWPWFDGRKKPPMTNLLPKDWIKQGREWKIWVTYHKPEHIREYNLGLLGSGYKLFNARRDPMNTFMCEFVTLRHVWLYQLRTDFVGFAHYSRLLNVTRLPNRGECQVLKQIHFRQGENMRSQYARCHNVKDFDLMLSLIDNRLGNNNPYTHYMRTSRTMLTNVCFLMSWKDFMRFADFLFPLLDDFAQETGCECDPDKWYQKALADFGQETASYQQRCIGFIAERLVSAWISINLKWYV